MDTYSMGLIRTLLKEKWTEETRSAVIISDLHKIFSDDPVCSSCNTTEGVRVRYVAGRVERFCDRCTEVWDSYYSRLQID